MAKPRARSCAYCGSTESLTVDHVVPLSRWREFGVRRRVLDNDSNRVVCCRRCNGEKGCMAPREWLQLHPDYKRRLIAGTRYLSDAVREIAGLARDG